MKTLHFSLQINAPRAKVWDTMLNGPTYTEWTKPFGESGRVEGDWSEGSKMLFIGHDSETNTEMGMVSRIVENRLHEYVSIEHLGLYKDGVEDLTSEQAKMWTPAFENYTFTDKDGGTFLEVSVDTIDEYADFFNETWPQALQILKNLSEA